MAEHAEPQERQGHGLGEEHPADVGRHIGECESHAADDKVLKRRSDF